MAKRYFKTAYQPFSGISLKSHISRGSKNMKYLESMANALNVDYDKFIAVSKSVGILKSDGFPRKKYIDDGYFNEDGTIANYTALKQLYSEKLATYLG